MLSVHPRVLCEETLSADYDHTSWRLPALLDQPEDTPAFADMIFSPPLALLLWLFKLLIVLGSHPSSFRLIWYLALHPRLVLMDNLGQEMENITQRIAALTWSPTQPIAEPSKEGGIEASEVVLVGRIVANRTFPIHAVRGILSKAWAFDPQVEIGDLAPNRFLFEFSSKIARDRVLERQPWNVKGYSLILKVWPLGLT